MEFLKMPANRLNDQWAGFGISQDQTFTIPSGTDGSAVAAIDLGRNYAFIIVRCADASNIAAASVMSAEVGVDDGDTLAELWIESGASAWASGTLPVTGTFQFVVPAAFGCQRIRLIVSVVTDGDVDLEIIGIDSGILAGDPSGV